MLDHAHTEVTVILQPQLSAEISEWTGTKRQENSQDTVLRPRVAGFLLGCQPAPNGDRVTD